MKMNPTSSTSGGFNQTSTQAFFSQPEGKAAPQPNEPMSASTHSGNLGPKHQKNASQYTPQLAQSLKHTITQGEPGATDMANHPQDLGEGSNTQVIIHPGAQSKKLSVQHRKNKSVLSTQIRINPQPGNQKLRQSQDNTSKQRLNQYFDNYTDQVQQSNIYMQQMQNLKSSHLSLTQNPH